MTLQTKHNKLCMNFNQLVLSFQFKSNLDKWQHVISISEANTSLRAFTDVMFVPGYLHLFTLDPAQNNTRERGCDAMLGQTNDGSGWEELQLYIQYTKQFSLRLMIVA